MKNVIFAAVCLLLSFECVSAGECSKDTVYEDVSSGTRISCEKALEKVSLLQKKISEHKMLVSRLRARHIERVKRVSSTGHIAPEPAYEEALRELRFLQGDLETFKAFVALCEKDGCLK